MIRLVSLTTYTMQAQRRVLRAHLGFTLKTPANDVRCKGCGALHCDCPDMVFGGVVPPVGAA